MMKNRPATSDTFIKNLAFLMNKTDMKPAGLARKSGVSPRMVAYVLSRERVPSIDIAGALAAAFGLTGWQLLAPFLIKDLEESGNLEKLITNYCDASKEGRDYISHVAEKEASYRQK